MKLTKSTLKNGTRLLMAPQDGTGSVTLLILFAVGSRYEDDRIKGISHFLEHMMFKGTKKRPTALSLSQELDAIGAEFNAFTSKEYTGYYIKAPAKYLALLFDILEDMLMHSLFSPTEIKKEKGPVIEEIHMRHDNPLWLIGDLTEEVVFGDNTLGKDIAGTPQTVRNITRKNLVTYFKQHYHAGNMLVGVAGSFAETTVQRLAQKHLSKFPSQPKIPHKEEIIAQTAPRFHVAPRKSAQLLMSLSFLAYPHKHPNQDALDLLTTVLGQGMSSRLFVAVREHRGLAYSVSASNESYHDTGIFTVDAGVDPKRIEEALKAIIVELKKVKTKGITKEELHKAKEQTKGRLTLALENSREMSQWVTFQECFDDGARTTKERFKEIDRVTLEDVKRVARDILKKETLNLVIIGTPKDQKRLEKIVLEAKLS